MGVWVRWVEWGRRIPSLRTRDRYVRFLSWFKVGGEEPGLTPSVVWISVRSLERTGGCWTRRRLRLFSLILLLTVTGN
jgi:hypothetical protein